MALEIRRYQSSDRDAVWKLHVAALEAVGTRRPGPWDNDFQDIEGVYLKNRGEFLVGLIEGQIIAMGALRLAGEETAEIKRMRVAPEHWRHGYGQAVFDRLQARAIELGFRRLVLDTTIQMTAAQELYRKNGFQEVGRKMVGPFETILSEKEL
jgi:ribosomal protein S18 acetylase RimI-like enzyme